MDDARGTSHLIVLGRSCAEAHFAPCVLDLLGHARPQAHAAMESPILVAAGEAFVVKRLPVTLAESLRRALRAVVLAPILAYQRLVSPAFPRRCKYEPTCSAYAVQAIRELGVVRGSILTAWRVLRCNPFSHGGYDPVETRRFFRATTNPAAPGREAEEAAGMIQAEGIDHPAARGRVAEHAAGQ